MSAPFSWIKPEPHGIYIPPADCWVDPSRAVGKALVTHGHADHARGGHGETVATPETLAIMELRYRTGAEDDAGEIPHKAVPVEYGETIRLKGGVDATYIPAGHVLGSAQILLEHAGERVIVTGDYKRREDPTCPPFEVTPCDIFITEATFGLPLFTHPPIEDEMAKLLDRLAAHPDRCVLVGAYALGKAQRVIAELRRAAHRSRSTCTARWRRCAGSMRSTVSIWTSFDRGRSFKRRHARRDRRLPAFRPERPLEPPPARSDHRDGQRLERVRQRARQRNVELPLVISTMPLGRADAHDQGSDARRTGSRTGAGRRCAVAASRQRLWR